MTALALILGGIVLILLYDLTQKQHAILRNYPILGHLRYLLENIGPELRQYITAGDREERPFDRNQRSWVYASAKKVSDQSGFGTNQELELSENYLIIKHAMFPLHEARPGEPSYDATYQIPSAKILGEYRGRKKAFRPKSIVNVSGMSYGSLSPNAVTALNLGCKLSNCLHNTGEGGIAPAHASGGELIWQIGSGYFGCRDNQGRFSLPLFLEKVQSLPIKAIEIKLSQGAKPGIGGVLPGSKVTQEIANIRGVVPGQDCISPAIHSAFSNIDEMLDFVELLADQTGLPIGIKSAVGEITYWQKLAQRMAETGRAVDFITIDGGEGGTGAAPLVFADHVALPFKMAQSRVFREFVPYDLHDKIAFIGSGKLGFPEAALFAFGLGCDLINVGREALLSIGCIQAAICHTNRCPTGVTTHSKWLQRGLDPDLKSVRFANYIAILRKEILRLCRACGVQHPALITSDHLEVINAHFQGRTVSDLFNLDPSWCLPNQKDREAIIAIMTSATPQPKPTAAPTLEDAPCVPHPLQ